jgi:adenylate cyclase
LILLKPALALDGDDQEVLRQASWIIALPGGDLSGGIALVNKAVDLDPNNVAARERAGEVYAYAGDKQSAIAQLERSVRLNPINRTLGFHLAYALKHSVASEHEATVKWTGKVPQVLPNHADRSLRVTPDASRLLA